MKPRSSSKMLGSPRSNGKSKLTSSQMSSKTPSEADDSILKQIRELQTYIEEDDRDSSVNIVVEPGWIVNANQDSEAPERLFKLPKCAKIFVAGVSALVGVAAVVQAVLDALK